MLLFLSSAAWWWALLGSVDARADDDGDGFSVAQGDCDDADPTTFPGAPERCDGFDNDCSQPPGLHVTTLMALSHGGMGDALVWRPTDGSWLHLADDGTDQWLVPLDIPGQAELDALVERGFAPHPVPGPLDALEWFPPFGQFVLSGGGQWFYVDDAGHSTQVGPGQARDLAALGGSLYATRGGVAGSFLDRLDPSNGDAWSSVPITDGVSWLDCHGLAPDAATGQLWAVCDTAGVPWACTSPDPSLYRVDPTTGAATPVGPVPYRFDSMAADGAGRLVALTTCAFPSALFELVPLTPGGPDLAELDEDWDGWLACEECNDRNGTVWPGATEVCDGLDNDCDGELPRSEWDNDGDGFVACLECDDGDPATYPGGYEYCDGRDNDCDGELGPQEVDEDGDGWSACFDCNDADKDTYPGARELCDLLDNDCDGELARREVRDDDGDGVPRCLDPDDSDPDVTGGPGGGGGGGKNSGNKPKDKAQDIDGWADDSTLPQRERLEAREICGCVGGCSTTGSGVHLGWLFVALGLLGRRREER